MNVTEQMVEAAENAASMAVYGVPLSEIADSYAANRLEITVRAALEAATALSQAEGAQVPARCGLQVCQEKQECIKPFGQCLALPTRPREQEGAEPVAWRHRWKMGDGWDGWRLSSESLKYSGPDLEEVPLYAHPLPTASFQAGAEGWNYDMEAAPKDGTRLWVYRPCIIEPDDCQEVSWWHTDFSGASYWRNAADSDKPDPIAWRSLPIPASSEGR